MAKNITKEQKETLDQAILDYLKEEDGTNKHVWWAVSDHRDEDNKYTPAQVVAGLKRLEAAGTIQNRSYGSRANWEFITDEMIADRKAHKAKIEYKDNLVNRFREMGFKVTASGGTSNYLNLGTISAERLLEVLEAND